MGLNPGEGSPGDLTTGLKTAGNGNAQRHLLTQRSTTQQGLENQPQDTARAHNKKTTRALGSSSQHKTRSAHSRPEPRRQSTPTALAGTQTRRAGLTVRGKLSQGTANPQEELQG